MSGHVFHPGHHLLHGITVVITLRDARLLVGRFDRQDERGYHLLDAGVHDPAADDDTREDYLQRTLKYGVKAEHSHLHVPAAQVETMQPLREVVVP